MKINCKLALRSAILILQVPATLQVRAQGELAPLVTINDMIESGNAVDIIAEPYAGLTGGSFGPVGDINGDGINDWVIGAMKNEQAYVVYGRS